MKLQNLIFVIQNIVRIQVIYGNIPIQSTGHWHDG